jgi:thiosulfate/3-mercaptopyruvate sulfurtransferase
MRAWLAILATLASGGAPDGDPGMLVTGAWLEPRLGAPGLVILHVGAESDYADGHIPGARLITVNDISKTGEGGLRLELPDAPTLAAAFGKAGVAADSRIVVYAGGELLPPAMRVWFTLDSAGLGERASILDGGLALWREEGRPLASAPSAAAAAEPGIVRLRGTVVDAAWVQAHLDDPATAIIDARPPAATTAGRISGARVIPYSSLFDEKRRLLPKDELRLRLGGGQPRMHVFYCNIGLQATVHYFVARYLGLDARLYDGSFQDWGARAGLPVETGPPK